MCNSYTHPVSTSASSHLLAGLDFKAHLVPSFSPLKTTLRWNLINILCPARAHLFRTKRVFPSTGVVSGMLAHLRVPLPLFPCFTPPWLTLPADGNGGPTFSMLPLHLPTDIACVIGSLMNRFPTSYKSCLSSSISGMSEQSVSPLT